MYIYIYIYIHTAVFHFFSSKLPPAHGHGSGDAAAHHVCCETQLTCLLHDTADMSAV